MADELAWKQLSERIAAARMQPPMPVPPGARIEMGHDPGTDTAYVTLRGPLGGVIDTKVIESDHLRDAMLYGRGAMRAQAQAQVEPPLKKHSNAELIHEMLERGYAVMKMPADGGPPEVFRK